MVYTLSNHQTNVMQGLWKDLPYKINKRISENWVDVLCFLVPTVGTYQCAPGRRGRRTARPRRQPYCSSLSRLTDASLRRYAVNYRHQEKLHHRY